MSSITALSTISMTVIDAVSAASANPSTVLSAMPARKSCNMVEA